MHACDGSCVHTPIPFLLCALLWFQNLDLTQPPVVGEPVSTTAKRMLPDLTPLAGSLTALSLANNKFTRLPPCFAKLTNLRVLDLSGKRVGRPESFFAASTMLRIACVHGCGQLQCHCNCSRPQVLIVQSISGNDRIGQHSSYKRRQECCWTRSNLHLNSLLFMFFYLIHYELAALTGMSCAETTKKHCFQDVSIIRLHWHSDCNHIACDCTAGNKELVIPSPLTGLVTSMSQLAILDARGVHTECGNTSYWGPEKCTTMRHLSAVAKQLKRRKYTTRVLLDTQ